jgi:ATP-dependent Clp protease ATP-binding subunit ClpA
MRMDKLTTKFQQALAEAQSLALGRDHQFIEPVHLMVALLDQEGGGTRSLLAKSDVNVNALRTKLSQASSFSISPTSTRRNAAINIFRASCSCSRRSRTRASSAAS